MKICIVCFDFKESNIRLQPWRYIYEISKRMKSWGVDIEIVSDGYPTLPQKDDVGGVTVHRLRQLRSLPFVRNRKLIRLIDEESPDVILWSIGVTSFYFIRTLKKINKPIVGLWMGTTYSLKEIMSLGLGEITRNFRFIYVHVVNTLMPSFLIKYVLTLPIFKRIITLNENNRERIHNYGIVPDKISVIPPGLDSYDLILPDKHEVEKLMKETKLEKDSFVMLYLGSPLTLRGVDTVINAAAIASKKIPSLRLIILSRRRSDNLSDEENHIKRLCVKKKIADKTKIISGFLDMERIKNFIALSDVVTLPFKLVQSDTPISILEVMALGKPVISTKADGIPELLDGRRGWLINQNDSKDLADAISLLYLNTQLRKEIGERAREYMLNHPTWDQTTQSMIGLIKEVTDQNSNTVGDSWGKRILH